MQTPVAKLYEFGEFQLDTGKRLLRRLDGTPVPLTPRVFDTLLYMVRHHDAVLDKERIMNQTEANSICTVCVNDIVSDQDYRNLFALTGRDGTILIPTVPLERSFPGGYLELSPETRAVRRIVEKPQGGCPAGAAANIMVSSRSRTSALLSTGEGAVVSGGVAALISVGAAASGIGAGLSER